MTAGKGSKQRPTDKQKFDEAFDTIFRPLCTECGKRICNHKEAEKSASSLLEDQKNVPD